MLAIARASRDDDGKLLTHDPPHFTCDNDRSDFEALTLTEPVEGRQWAPTADAKSGCMPICSSMNPTEFPVNVGSQLAHEHHHELSCSPRQLFWPAFSLTLHFAGSAPTSERLRLLRTTPAAHCGTVISSMTWP